MKYLVLLFVSFYQLEVAYAQESLNPNLIDEQLQKMANQNVIDLPFHAPTIKFYEHNLVDAVNSPISCDVIIDSRRHDMQMDTSCDPKKTIRSETLAIAASE